MSLVVSKVSGYFPTSNCMHDVKQTEGWLQHRGMLWNVSVSKKSKHYQKPTASCHFGKWVLLGILNPLIDISEKNIVISISNAHYTPASIHKWWTGLPTDILTRDAMFSLNPITGTAPHRNMGRYWHVTTTSVMLPQHYQPPHSSWYALYGCKNLFSMWFLNHLAHQSRVTSDQNRQF